MAGEAAQAIGSVEVDVRANLEPYQRDLAGARAEADRFYSSVNQTMDKVSTSTDKASRSQADFNDSMERSNVIYVDFNRHAIEQQENLQDVTAQLQMAASETDKLSQSTQEAGTSFGDVADGAYKASRAISAATQAVGGLAGVAGLALMTKTGREAAVAIGGAGLTAGLSGLLSVVGAVASRLAPYLTILTAVIGAIRIGNREYQELLNIAERASKTDVGIATFQGFAKAVGSIELATTALQKFAEASKDTLDKSINFLEPQELKRRITDAEMEVRNLWELLDRPIVGRAEFLAAKTAEERLRPALLILQDLEKAGLRLEMIDLAGTLFGSEFQEQLRKGKIELTDIDRIMRQLRGGGLQGILPEADVRRAEAVNKAIEETRRKIDDNLRPAYLGLANVTIEMENAWLQVLKVVEKTTSLIGPLVEGAASGIKFNVQVATTGATWIFEALGLTGDTPKPLHESVWDMVVNVHVKLAQGAVEVLRTAGIVGPAESAPVTGVRKGSDITAPLTGMDIPMPRRRPQNIPVEEANKTANEFDSAMKSVSRYVATLEAQKKAVDASAGAQAQLRVEAQLTEAAIRSKLDPATGEVAEKIRKMGERARQAAQEMAELRLKSDLDFERKTIGLPDSEQRVAQSMRQIYGKDWENQMNSALAMQVRFNEQLKQTKDLAVGFADSFVQGIMSGQTAMQSFSNALRQLASQLASMAVRNLVGSLFGGFGRAGAGTSIIPGLLHSGGMGRDAPSSGIILPPSAFAGAPRFHDGKAPWKPGEMPAIIKPEEEILTTSDPRHRWNQGQGGAAQQPPVIYQDNRTFNDVTPEVEARLDARMRAREPELINKTIQALQKRRGWDPNVYGPQ